MSNTPEQLNYTLTLMAFADQFAVMNGGLKPQICQLHPDDYAAVLDEWKAAGIDHSQAEEIKRMGFNLTINTCGERGKPTMLAERIVAPLDRKGLVHLDLPRDSGISGVIIRNFSRMIDNPDSLEHGEPSYVRMAICTQCKDLFDLDQVDPYALEPWSGLCDGCSTEERAKAQSMSTGAELVSWMTTVSIPYPKGDLPPVGDELSAWESKGIHVIQGERMPTEDGVYIHIHGHYSIPEAIKLVRENVPCLRKYMGEANG